MKHKIIFSKTVYLLLSIILLISLLGVIWNIYSLVAYSNVLTIFNTISHAIVLVVCVVIFLFALSVMAFSKYVIENNVFIAYFGLIKTSVKTNSIISVKHFKKSNKLVVYFEDATYTTILIPINKYDRFIKDLRTANTKIVYDELEEDNK